MKSLLRRWLGYDEVVLHLLHLQEENLAVHKHLADLHDEMIGMRSDLAATFRDEFDPKRKEMSERLAQRAITKLKAEDQARRHTLGEIE